jgi:cell division GTPase FtsZ
MRAAGARSAARIADIVKLDVKIDGAMGALVNVTGGPDMTVAEAEKVAEIVGQKINPNARIIWGCRVEPDMEKTVRVMLVVTGLKEGLPPTSVTSVPWSVVITFRSSSGAIWRARMAAAANGMA